jgi:hypothetical protein
LDLAGWPALPGGWWLCAVGRPTPKPPYFRPAQASFFKPFSQSGQILCRFRLALQRTSGPWIALPAHRLYYPVDMWPRCVDHTGLLRRSARCSVTTRRTRVQSNNGRLSDRLRFCKCSPVLCDSSAGQPRRKNGLLHADGEQTKRPPSRTRHQASKRSGEDIAKGLSHLVLVPSVTAEPRRRLVGAQDFIA